MEENTDYGEFRKALGRAKRKLKIRAERRGVWADFGEKEIRRLRNEFDYIGNSDIMKDIHEFSDWCRNYEGEE